MAVLNTAYPTLADVASRLDENGDIAPVAEILSQNNAILKHLQWHPCNQANGYKHTIRTGIPTPTWRGHYEGVQPTKSTTASVVDTCSNVEAYGVVDCDTADLNGNTYKFRMSEEKAFIQGMGNEVAQALYYGDISKNIRKFNGLATRYNALSGAPCAHNVINCLADVTYSNTPDGYTSVFLVNLEEFFGLYPKGSKYGLQHTDKGAQTVDAPDGKGKMEAYVDHYKWQPGAALHDWSACARLCNIPIRNGQVDIDGDVLIQKLVVMKNRIPANLRRSQFLFVPEEVQTALELGALKMSSNVVKIVEASEQFKTNFFNVTIESDDAISKSEALIS